MTQDLYTSGAYLDHNPSWHVEESAWKAQQVVRMLRRHALAPTTITEVGCGAGEVLRQLQASLPADCHLWGYDISPHALALCQSRANERLHFLLGDVTQEAEAHFDLVLILDVVEHLEDYYPFLRALKPKAHYHILHLPLELSVQTILRRQGLLHTHELYGHLHYFTRETALQVMRNAGYQVLDAVYCRRALERGSTQWPRRLLHLPRALLSALDQDLAARVLGGFSLLVLATDAHERASC
jgi:SAM-dependent methyltransferase